MSSIRTTSRRRAAICMNPAASIHQFYVPEDATEWAEGFMVVSGANINFDDADQFVDVTDAGSLISAISAICQAMGRETPRYIKPGANADFTAAPKPSTAELVDA